MHLRTCFLFSLVLFFSCRNGEDPTITSFRKVESSLQRTSDSMNAASHRSDTRLLTKAARADLDTLLVAEQELNRLQEQLRSLDPEGGGITATEELLFRKGLATPLQRQMKQVYETGIRYAGTEELKKSFQSELNPPGNRPWAEAYFKNVPTVAALTMISKFKNDIALIRNLILQSRPPLIMDDN